MCNGSEYSLSDCPGYDLNGVSGGYCLSGDYQAGVRCIEGIYIEINFFLVQHHDIHPLLQCLLQLHLVTMETFAWRILLILTLMETISMEVEWKCAIMAPIVLCVMRVGLTVMLPSSVTTLVTAIHTIVSGNLSY